MVYLLTGENTFEIDRRLQEMTASFDGDIERLDAGELTPEQLPDLLAGVTLFSTKRLVIIKNASANKQLWAALGSWFEREIDNDIVIVDQTPDKRTKTYKWLEKHAELTSTRELQPREAVQWVGAEAKRVGLAISPELAVFLVDYVGTNQWRLGSELEKLALSGRSLSKELIRELVEPTSQATSFELLDAAFAGRHEQIEQLLSVVARQEDPYMFFGLLSGQIYALALMKTCGSKTVDSVAKATSIHPFVLRKVSALARQLSLTEIKRIVRELAELDANIKLRPTEPWTQIQATLLRLTS